MAALDALKLAVLVCGPAGVEVPQDLNLAFTRSRPEAPASRGVRIVMVNVLPDRETLATWPPAGGNDTHSIDAGNTSVIFAPVQASVSDAQR